MEDKMESTLAGSSWKDGDGERLEGLCWLEGQVDFDILIIVFLSRWTGQSKNKGSKILTLQSLKRYQTLIDDLWFQGGKFEWEYCSYVWSGMNCRFPSKMNNHSMNHEHVDISIIPALVSMDHPDPDWPQHYALGLSRCKAKSISELT